MATAVRAGASVGMRERALQGRAAAPPPEAADDGRAQRARRHRRRLRGRGGWHWLVQRRGRRAGSAAHSLPLSEQNQLTHVASSFSDCDNSDSSSSDAPVPHAGPGSLQAAERAATASPQRGRHSAKIRARLTAAQRAAAVVGTLGALAGRGAPEASLCMAAWRSASLWVVWVVKM